MQKDLQGYIDNIDPYLVLVVILEYHVFMDFFEQEVLVDEQ
jgi:hypothetical protein